MRKQYIIEVDESEIVEYWNEQAVKEIGYQEYALKQCPGIKVKPYNPAGDLISREALKETVELEEGIFWDSYSSGELIVRKEYIDNAPTVKFSLLPADESKEEAFMRGYEKGKIEGILKAHTRPKGEWILIKNSDGVLKCYECSECKKCQGYISNFCEDCGADMQQGGTEND